MKKKILIYGSKSYAKLLQTILREDFAIEPLCFIDDEPEKSQSSSDSILNLNDALTRCGKDVEILLGIGYSSLPARLLLIKKLKKLNLKLSI